VSSKGDEPFYGLHSMVRARVSHRDHESFCR
jgi:hypothetical protein